MTILVLVASALATTPSHAGEKEDWVRGCIARLGTIGPALHGHPFPVGTSTVSLTLRILLAKNGDIVSVRVAKSSGFPAYDEKARQLALQLKRFEAPPASVSAPRYLELPIIRRIKQKSAG